MCNYEFIFKIENKLITEEIMSVKLPFNKKIPNNRRKKQFFIFIIFSSILISSVYFYTYIQNSPIDSTEFTTIKIVTENNPNYESYISCTFQLSNIDGTEEFEPLKSKIRIRGSGTGWNEFSQKKGYRIKLTEDKSLLNLRKDDDWVLIGMYSDYPRMRIKMAFDTWRSLQEKNPTSILPKSRYVLLYLNGEFQGLYLLAEKNDRELFNLNEAQNNINSSLIFQTKFNTDLNTYDKEVWEQDWPNDYEGIFIMEEILTNLTSFISNSKDDEFFHEKTGIYSKFDKQNLIDFFIYNFFIQHKDFWDKNYFLIRNSYPNKFYFIPWDFDECFGQFAWKKYDADDNSIVEISEIRSKNELYNRLLGNSKFLEDCKIRWLELREFIWTDEYFSDMITNFYEEIKDVLELDIDLWNPGKYDENWSNDVYKYIKHLNQWILDRLEFCTLYFNSY